MAPYLVQYPFSEFKDREFLWITDVQGASHLRRCVHHQHHCAHEIVNVAETAALSPIAEDGNVVATQSLHDEIGNDAAIVGMHASTIGIEDPHDFNV
jgi:hypothetical protein